MMGYLALRDGEFTIRGTDFDGENLILQMNPHYSLPASFSNGTEEFYITGQDNLVSLLVKPFNGRIRQYYSDYKSYDYLPGEDMAVPKSISKFMEKGLKKAGWSASTLCRNDNNGNVCRRSTGASAVYGGSNGDTIGKGGAANGAAFYRGIFEGVLEEQTRGD